jgi:hypothetical protein
MSVFNQWYYVGMGSPSLDVLMAVTSNDGLVTVDRGGCVRLWETAVFNLSKSLTQWRNMIGEGIQQNLKVRLIVCHAPGADQCCVAMFFFLVPHLRNQIKEL